MTETRNNFPKKRKFFKLLLHLETEKQKFDVLLSKNAVSKIWGVSPMAVSYWENHTREIPPWRIVWFYRRYKQLISLTEFFDVMMQDFPQAEIKARLEL